MENQGQEEFAKDEGQLFTEADIIISYTRAQAIEDGVLVDVTETAKESGFLFPVAVTENLWNGYIEPDQESAALGQDAAGRLWDVLTMLKYQIRRCADGNILQFQVVMILKGKRRLVEMKSVAGPGDSGEPVITIMLPNED